MNLNEFRDKICFVFFKEFEDENE